MTILTALNTWKRNAERMWKDIAAIEAYLLFVALLHRDLELLDFDFDVDTPLASRPPYFEQSLLKSKYFGMVTAALSKIARTIPIEGEGIAPRATAPAVPSPPSPTHEIPEEEEPPPRK